MTQLSPIGTFTLMAIASLTIMVGCVLVPGLSLIAPALGMESYASWLITVPALGVVLFGVIAGKFIHKSGAYKALAVGLFLYGATGFAGMFLHGLIPELLDRLLLGGATAVVMASGTSLLSHFFSGEKRLKMMAVQGMSIELGGVIFLFIGGLLASVGWQYPFVLYLVAWVLLVMQLCFIPVPEKTTKHHTTSDENLAASRSLQPILFAALISMICFFTAIINLPIQLSAAGFTPAQTGYYLSFVSLIAMLAALMMPRVVQGISQTATLSLSFVLYAFAHLMFFADAGMPGYLVGAVMMGAGFGFSVPLVNHMTVEFSAPAMRGKNLAILSVALFSGQFLSSFMSWLPGGMAVTFAGAVALSLLAAAALYLALRMPRPDNQHE